MPTYQYACRNADCGNQFELVQSFTDAPATECPVCGQAVRKVFGAVGVVFKGSGFYRTDSRKDGKVAAKSESSTSSSTTTTSSSSSSTDSSSASTKDTPSTKATPSTTSSSSSGGSSSAA